MMITRALVGTALSQVVSLWLASAAVAQGIPTNTAIASETPPAVIQKGTVLWRRGATEAELPPSAPVSAEIKRLHETITALQQQTEQKLATLKQEQARADEKTQAYTDLRVSKVQLEAQMAAVNEARQLARDVEQRTRELTDAKVSALSTQITSNQKLTELQMAELRKLNEESRALAMSEVGNVAAALRQYADSQIARAAATTSATLVNLAQATDQNLAALDRTTNKKLNALWQAANQNASKLAEEKANAVAASLAALQQHTEASRLTPEQIRRISEQAVAESAPEFRAIALKTMQESQDYIRTVARTAVQDKDPGMTAALADVARDVITKDDNVVFAIRKTVADELQGAITGTTPESQSVRLGPDHDKPVAESEDMDPNRLRIAQLLAPGTLRPAPDAAGMAAIEPAAGPGSAPAGQLSSWAAPGVSVVSSRPRADWMDIRMYKVIVHEDDQTLQELMAKVLKQAEPFTGPWQVRWKISAQNTGILTEKFSIDAETTFEEFVSYLAQYVVNDRGVKLSFSLFDNERVIVVSD